MRRGSDVDLDTLNLISFCTGGAGLDLGVELAIPSARTVVMVERGAFACARLVSAMEEGLLAPAALWSDVRTFRGRQCRGLVDGLIGGIPCQPWSLAGEGRGADDERDLWPPTRRTLVSSGAWFFLLENVGGMLSKGGAARVRRDLFRLGFEVEAGLFTAFELGASDERERLFLLGCRAGVGQTNTGGLGGAAGVSASASGHGQSAEPEVPLHDSHRVAGVALGDPEGIGRREGWSEPELRRGRNAPASPGGGVVHTLGGERDGGPDEPQRGAEGRTPADRPSGVPLFPPWPDALDAWRETLERWPAVEPSVRGVPDGLASRVEQLSLLGNGVKPLQAAYALRTLAHRLTARGSTGAARLVRRMI